MSRGGSLSGRGSLSRGRGGRMENSFMDRMTHPFENITFPCGRNKFVSKIILHNYIFIKGSDLHWNLSCIPKDGSDISRSQFPVGKSGNV